MKFLKANWEHLILVNYKVPKTILEKYLPSHTFLDDFEGSYYVSVVGFMFKNTKVLGVKFPYHVNFEEVNLRFYVKDKNGNRGVVFIKEIVPKGAIKLIANNLYKEHYDICKMNHQLCFDSENLNVKYTWENKNSKNLIAVKTRTEEQELVENSKEEFFAEHYFGFTKISKNKTNIYEVKHPKWKHYRVVDYQVQLDFEENYGQDFTFLNQQIADSVFLMKGSEISVNMFNKTR
jgi:uncharacterized protein YqjF (DUF2071 family)